MNYLIENLSDDNQFNNNYPLNLVNINNVYSQNLNKIQCIDDSIIDQLSMYTKAQLKAMLLDAGIPIIGLRLKSDYVERYINFFNQVLRTPTKPGQQIIPGAAIPLKIPTIKPINIQLTVPNLPPFIRQNMSGIEVNDPNLPNELFSGTIDTAYQPAPAMSIGYSRPIYKI